MKILVIDDNVDITNMLVKYLETKNFDCTQVNDGKKGVELIKKSQYDAIILDLAMPEFSGYDVLEELEKSSDIKNNKILILTAVYLEPGDDKKFLEKGVFKVLQKPLKLKEIANILNNLEN